MLGKQKEWTPNTERLVRSAMQDERYCSYILDCLHLEQHDMTLQSTEPHVGQGEQVRPDRRRVHPYQKGETP
jgi:hypothetical protein